MNTHISRGQPTDSALGVGAGVGAKAYRHASAARYDL